MGCDIHSLAIDAQGTPIAGGQYSDGSACDPDYGVGTGEPFGWRSYSVFAFLAGVRNYSGITPISEPRGLPDDLKLPAEDDDVDAWLGDHSYSWLSVAELDAFDYHAEVEDRRMSEHGQLGTGPRTAAPGEGLRMPWREFLGRAFFHDLAELKRIGADRVVFGFDS